MRLDAVCPGYVTCESCGCARHAGHPIESCQRCEPEKYETHFAALRKRADWMYFLGHDAYSDAFYFWRDGIVVQVDGAFMRIMPGRVPDSVVADLTKLKAENTELLAENARLRRRLEGK